MPEEMDVCSSSPCLGLAWVTIWECEGVVAFYSEFTIPVAQKASWLLKFWNGRPMFLCGLGHQHVGVLFCGSGSVEQARSDTMLPTVFLFEEIWHFFLYYDLLQAGLRVRRLRHYRVISQAPG